MAKPNKAVVVFSGGQDSTTCLFWAKKKYDEVIALSFNYGQRHSKELECAKKICKEHGVEHHILDMGLLNQLAPNSLTRVDMEVDHEAPEEGTPNSFVDGRNMLFLTFAAVFAKQRDIHVLVTGVSQSDFSGYPDCRHVFISSLETTLTLAMDYEFEVITPLMWIDKKQTWEMADKLGVFDIVKLHKSENPEDILAFDNKEVEVIPTTEVVKKDSVVMYKGTRYRGYVYVNPSTMKVIRSSYSEGGISVDNVYYDNVIHICVYEGRRMLYGKDITKKAFAGIFPEDILSQMILADMNFMGVDNKGYQYQATLRVPESSVYSLADITIGFDNRMDIKKAE
jgi:7-cyano-7-deazaguanine synthase